MPDTRQSTKNNWEDLSRKQKKKKKIFPWNKIGDKIKFKTKTTKENPEKSKKRTLF